MKYWLLLSLTLLAACDPTEETQSPPFSEAPPASEDPTEDLSSVTPPADDSALCTFNLAWEPSSILERYVASPTVAAPHSECSDGIDNDGDGLTDWQFDLGCTSADDDSEGGLSTHSIENGWSVIEPESDTVIYYVSSSEGNDNNIGTDPDHPLETYNAALDKTRANQPDWILLKRGDVFTEPMRSKNGRSRNEPFVVASYGESTTRPLFKVGTARGLDLGNEAENISVIGLAFYAHTRNPDDPDYVAYDANNPDLIDGSSGLRLYRPENEPGSGILIENTVFSFFLSGGSIQGPGFPEDIRIRRNLFHHNYSNSSHSQGLFARNVIDFLVEGNVFDHNGWLIQSTQYNQVDAGQATIFNHSTYFNDINNMVYRNNISLRPSSMGTKLTSSNSCHSSNFLVANNLYIDGEIGIGLGSNYAEYPDRFGNILIRDNVLMEIGRSRPTNRSLGWGISVDGMVNAQLSNNLFAHNSNPAVDNTFGIAIRGFQKALRLNQNTLFDLHGAENKPVIPIFDGQSQENVTLSDNVLALYNSSRYMIEIPDSDGSQLTFTGNRYNNQKEAELWYRINGVTYSIDAWISSGIETDASADSITFCDDSRHINSYLEAQGETGSIDTFIALAKNQQKYAWQSRYEAPTINHWMREGFALCP